VIKRETDAYVDIYPFADGIADLPSARVSLYRETGKVTFNGDRYTPVEVEKLVEAFNLAFSFIQEVQSQREAEHEHSHKA
jgi:hypothetical protein